MVSRASQRKLHRKQARQDKKQRMNQFYTKKQDSIESAPKTVEPVPRGAAAVPVKNADKRMIAKTAKPVRELSDLEKAKKLKRTNPDLYHVLLKDNLIMAADTEVSIMGKDQLDMKRYAKKLKMKSTDSISSALKKDGLDFILDAVKDGRPSAESASEDDNTASDIDDFESENDDESVDESGTEEEFNDADHDDNDIEDSESDQESDEQSDQDESATDENQDGSDDGEGKVPAKEEPEFTASSQKYVPRMLRLQQQPKSSEAASSPEIKSDDYLRTQKQVQGHLNKLSEANIESIFSAIKDLYSSSRRHDVTDILTQRIMDLVSSPSNLAESFVINYVCLLKLVYSCVGTDVCAHFVQQLVEKYMTTFESLQATNTEDSAAAEESNKKCSNFMVLICYLFNFNIISSVLMSDIVMEIIKALKDEIQIDLVLKVIRISGFKLRSEDPTRLKDTIVELQSQTSRIESQSVRLKFMIEQVNNLKNNKSSMNKKGANGGDNSGIVERLKKFCRNYFKKVGAYEQEPLRCSLDDIQSVETKGKWWVVGAGWVGRQYADENLAPLVAVDESVQSNHKLLALAKKLGINMEVRRNIFVILMSSEDYIDAFERLMKLGLKAKQEREIVRMITYCCGLEKRYNPFYAVLAHHMCHNAHNHKITFQFTLWDFLKQLTAGEDTFSLRRMTNIAMFYSSLIEKQALSMSILKSIDFGILIRDSIRSELSPLCIFVQVMLTSLLVIDGETDDRRTNDVIAGIYGKLATFQDLEMLRQGLRLVMTNLLKKRLDAELPAIVESICVIKQANYAHVLQVLAERILLARQCLKAPTQLI